MTKHEVTREVAPGAASRGGSLRGLPQEPSRNKSIFVQPPKLSDLASAPRGHFFRFKGNSKLRSKEND